MWQSMGEESGGRDGGKARTREREKKEKRGEKRERWGDREFADETDRQTKLVFLMKKPSKNHRMILFQILGLST